MIEMYSMRRPEGAGGEAAKVWDGSAPAQGERGWRPARKPARRAGRGTTSPSTEDSVEIFSRDSVNTRPG